MHAPIKLCSEQGEQQTKEESRYILYPTILVLIPDLTERNGEY